jgi:hypothetical protein
LAHAAQGYEIVRFDIGHNNNSMWRHQQEATQSVTTQLVSRPSVSTLKSAMVAVSRFKREL